MVSAIAVKTMNPPKNGFKKHLLANPFLEDVCSEITILGRVWAWPQTIARTTQNMAGELSLGLDRMFGFS